MDLRRIKDNTMQMIWRFSIPSILAMVLTSLITLADGFFIGNYVGKEGIAAVNLGLPIVYLFLAIGLMVSVGGVAIAGMAQGAGDREKCTAVFSQTIATSAAVSVLVGIAVLLCFTPMLKFLRAEGAVAGHFRAYYRIMLLEYPVMVVNSSLGMFIRGEGNPRFPLKTNAASVFLNVLLDYFASSYLGLGVSGIAAASLISGIFLLSWNLLYFIKRARVYTFRAFSFDKSVLGRTLANGSSEFIGELSTGIAMFAYNLVIMRRFGADGVTAFTIVGYISYVFSMILVGFGQGASPLISFTYGAGERELAKEIRRKTNGCVFAAGLFVIAVMTASSGWYSRLFVENEAVSRMVRSGMVIFMTAFLFSGINTITSFYFTSIGRAKESAVISFSRGLVILLLCIFTLPLLFGMTGVWMAAPVTEGATLLITLFYLRRDAG